MKIAIIGAGPIGLYFATLCQDNNIDYTIFEASNIIGGQLTHIYPKKEIVNIPNIKLITAENYIKQLFSKLDSKNIKLNVRINNIDELKNKYDYIIIATGIGEYQPRKLGLENEEKYNVLYSLDDLEFLKNKKVVVFGGGDSALDWAKQLSDIADTVLVHRRNEFRGNADTIKDCHNLHIFMSFAPYSIDNTYIGLKSTDGLDTIMYLPYDYILVNFGIVPVKTNFKLDNKTFIIGDALEQTRTIAFGIESANKIFKQIIGE